MIESGDGSGPRVLERRKTPRGELVLRQAGSHFEVISNGVFLMDSRETGSERALAEQALAGVRPGARVLVGGFGLGYTLRAVLDHAHTASAVVAEIEPALVRWGRSTLAHVSDGALNDSRVCVEEGDVRDVLAAADAEFDAILLDVDNGPSWTVHDANAQIYAATGLEQARRALALGGVLAVWAAQAEPDFARSLGEHFGDVREVRVPVERDGRSFDYFIYLAAP